MSERHVDMSKATKVDLLDDGLLWLLNTTALNPRGFSLALHEGEFYIVGDGTEPVSFTSDVADAKFEAVEALLAKVRERHG